MHILDWILGLRVLGFLWRLILRSAICWSPAWLLPSHQNHHQRGGHLISCLFLDALNTLKLCKQTRVAYCLYICIKQEHLRTIWTLCNVNYMNGKVYSYCQGVPHRPTEHWVITRLSWWLRQRCSPLKAFCSISQLVNISWLCVCQDEH